MPGPCIQSSTCISHASAIYRVDCPGKSSSIDVRCSKQPLNVTRSHACLRAALNTQRSQLKQVCHPLARGSWHSSVCCQVQLPAAIGSREGWHARRCHWPQAGLQGSVQRQQGGSCRGCAHMREGQQAHVLGYASASKCKPERLLPPLAHISCCTQPVPTCTHSLG